MSVFGTEFLPFISQADYREGVWSPAQTMPLGAMGMSPACGALHYGQIAFEGMKAFPTPRGLSLFRPRDHHARLTRSCERLAMASPPWEVFQECSRLVLEKRDPSYRKKEGGVYLRPLVMAWENFLGVRAATAYRFLVLACPAEDYFPGVVTGKEAGLRLITETNQARACPGGTGDIKTPGNYAASLAAAAAAKRQGFNDVLWLDAHQHRYVEEAGAMNIFFRLGDTLVTPTLQGSILDGVTRRSVLALARDLGIKTLEKPVSVEELSAAHQSGAFTEAFGTGTAAGIAPIREIEHAGSKIFHWKGGKNPTWTGPLSERLRDIQRGKVEEWREWLTVVG